MVKLLVVEDDKELLLLLRHFFQDSSEIDADMSTRTDVAAAKIRRGFKPDAALIDFGAQGRNTSIDLLELIAKKLPDCRLYLMSGMSRVKLERATEGVVEIQHIFEKPFSIQTMIERISVCCDDKKRRTLGLTRYPISSDPQLNTLRDLLHKEPDDVAVRQLYAFSLYTAEQFRLALTEYKKLADSGHSTFLCEYYCGHTCARLHLFDDAINCWQRALELVPHEGAQAKVRQRIHHAKEILRMEQSSSNAS